MASKLQRTRSNKEASPTTSVSNHESLLRQEKDKQKGTPIPSSSIKRRQTQYIIKKMVLYSDKETEPIQNTQFSSDIFVEKEVEKLEVGSNIEIVDQLDIKDCSLKVSDNPLVINLEQEIEEGLETQIQSLPNNPSTSEASMIEEVQSSPSAKLVFTKHQLDQITLLAPFLEKTDLTEEDINYFLDFVQHNPDYNPFENFDSRISQIFDQHSQDIFEVDQPLSIHAKNSLPLLSE